MIRTRTAFALAAALAMAPCFAHHGVAPHYDDSKIVTLDGTVSEFQFINPHSFVYLRVTANGQEAVWHCEMASRSVLEPAYGIFNARFVYEPAARNYSVEVWGKNLLDALYVNGGFDTRDTWGYDFSIVGRSRELGVGLSFKF